MRDRGPSAATGQLAVLPLSRSDSIFSRICLPGVTIPGYLTRQFHPSLTLYGVSAQSSSPARLGPTEPLGFSDRGVMNVLTSGKRAGLGIGAIALLLIAGPFSNVSWAGCNHLVRSTQELEANSAIWRLDTLIAGPDWAMGGQPNGSPTRSSQPRPAPCSGPSCSGQVPLPVSTTISLSVPIESWGLLSLSELASPAPSRFWQDQDAEFYSLSPACSIFHPPRTSPA